MLRDPASMKREFGSGLVLLLLLPLAAAAAAAALPEDWDGGVSVTPLFDRCL